MKTRAQNIEAVKALKHAEWVYRCNLCGDYLQPTDSAAKGGFGVHFVAGGASVFKRAHETEQHICHQCARSVHDEMRKVMPAEVGA